MKQEVQVPEVGESVSSGILASWLKQSGEMVEEGEELFELETDKATLAVPSPADGVLTIQVDEDTEVEVGQVVASIDTEAQATAEAGEEVESDADEEARGQSDEAGESADGEPGKASETDSASLSPAVRRVVEEHDLDVSSISGSGKDGRITKEDALKAVDQKDSSQATPSEEQAPSGKKAGTGEAGGPKESAGRPSSTTAARADRGERQVRKPMSNLRKRIAEKLVQSQQTAAHLTTFNEVDMSQVIDIRKAYRDEFESKHGVRLGFMSFFLKASQKALAEYDEVNAFVDGTEIVYNNYYDIGVALSSDRGLITPVVRNVDSKGFAEIEQEILDFIKRAKNRRIMPDELSGGTFTISNGGVFGSMLSTPIPNPPQTAVLGMHAIQKRPVVDENDQIVVKPMMYLALTYDHRILDGKDAIGFLKKIKTLIEDPYQMLLEL